MRTTVDLPADLHAQVVAIARDTHRTLSETVAFLMRRGLGESQAAGVTHSAATGLPDTNVLTALVVDDHVHHGQAEAWFASSGTGFATCPITQGSLMRLLIREGQTAELARSVLREVTSSPRHEFWPDSASCLG